MTKLGTEEIQIEAFEADAPRGKKKGGADLLIPLNHYEKQMIAAGAKLGRRSVSAFIRNAALDEAIKQIEKNNQSTQVD